MSIVQYRSELRGLLNEWAYSDTEEWRPHHEPDIKTKEDFLSKMGEMWDKSTEEGVHPTCGVGDGDAVACITGMTKNAEHHAVLIAFLLSNAQFILDYLDDIAKRAEDG